MLFRKLVVVGLVGFVSFAANIATAQDAVAPSNFAIDGVDLADPAQAFANRFEFNVGDKYSPRFSALGPADPGARQQADAGYELQFVTPAMSGINVSFAQRGADGFNSQGDLERQSRASELRLGQGVDMRFALQDRVEIGDMQVGITYERYGIQASLAYVEREISVRTVGSQGFKQDENFAGFTLTMRN
jgi:hypothetical protein